MWGEWQTTLAAEEKVESMKLVVLAAQSIRSASRAPRSCFFSLILFDNYANAGMIVGQYVLGIKVESSNSVIFMILKRETDRAWGEKPEGDDRKKKGHPKRGTRQVLAFLATLTERETLNLHGNA